MKDFAVQADAAHQPVHDERRARHVAGVFQQADEEKENQNLRQETEHAADAADDAVGEQIAQIARRHRGFHPVGQRGDAGRRSSPSAPGRA